MACFNGYDGDNAFRNEGDGDYRKCDTYQKGEWQGIHLRWRTKRFSGFRTPARLLPRKRRAAGEEYAETAGWALSSSVVEAKASSSYGCDYRGEQCSCNRVIVRCGHVYLNGRIRM